MFNFNKPKTPLDLISNTTIKKNEDGEDYAHAVIPITSPDSVAFINFTLKVTAYAMLITFGYYFYHHPEWTSAHIDLLKILGAIYLLLWLGLDQLLVKELHAEVHPGLIKFGKTPFQKVYIRAPETSFLLTEHPSAEQEKHTMDYLRTKGSDRKPIYQWSRVLCLNLDGITVRIEDIYGKHPAEKTQMQLQYLLKTIPLRKDMAAQSLSPARWSEMAGELPQDTLH